MMSDQPMHSNPLLEVKGVSKFFYGVTALNNVNMVVYPGERVSLIGPNGSGKTTLFNCITGFLRPEQGQVLFGGKEMTHLRPDRIALSGIGRTFQHVSIFPGLTLLQNLLVSLQQHQEENIIKRALRTPDIRDLEKKSIIRAEEMLEMIGLLQFKDEKAESLVYGQRKLLEFGCTLIAEPDLIMLDEPAAGVNTAMVDQMKRYILDLNQKGKTFLIVEHNMGVVMDISQRIVVLDHGEKIAEGTPAEIRMNERVLEAYFGK